MSLQTLKKYIRVDYDDDDEIIEMMMNAVIEEMKELITDFDPDELTKRQELLICVYVKDLYDNRDRMTQASSKSEEKVRYAVQSLMLKERLR